MTTRLVYDCTHSAIGYLPGGVLAAGYTTGWGGVQWTPGDFANHPGAIHIDQDPSASDACADVLDVEDFAATPAECPGWVKAARSKYNSNARPGQRKPAVYCNGAYLTAVCNSLAAAGVTDVGIWLARPGIPQATAIGQVASASGPYPLIGVQYAWASHYDISVFSSAWLDTVSGGGTPPQPGTAPAFPYPAGDYLGIASADPCCHSGYYIGDRPHIATWQAQMARRGWAVTADGQYGPQSEQACRGFQADKGLTVDGKVGPATWMASWTAPVT